MYSVWGHGVKTFGQTVFPPNETLNKTLRFWIMYRNQGLKMQGVGCCITNTINHFYIDTITVSADIILFLLYYLHSVRYQCCCYMSGIIFTFIVKDLILYGLFFKILSLGKCSVLSVSRKTVKSFILAFIRWI